VGQVHAGNIVGRGVVGQRGGKAERRSGGYATSG
jgi:hypothetical protein